MRPFAADMSDNFREKLAKFSKDIRPLPGILSGEALDALVPQIIDSMRRAHYFACIRNRPISPARREPTSDCFDPHRAALLYFAEGEIEEAMWLVFLATHFGRSRTTGWALVRLFYGALAGPRPWSWSRTSADPMSVRRWLVANDVALRGTGARFGNHRKRESIDGVSPLGTGAVVESYVAWVKSFGSHREMLLAAADSAAGPGEQFEFLFRSMQAVHRFGRLGRFDYLVTTARLGLSELSPDHAYLVGASGPIHGARRLFGVSSGAANARTLEKWLQDLDLILQVGPDVLEDALCNWNKSPTSYRRFYG